MTLEEQLREAAVKGLASLTLYAEWSADHKTTYWTCRATPSARHGYVGVEHDTDLVNALGACLKALPSAKLRESKKVTVPVTNSGAVPENNPEPAEPATTHPSFDEWMK